MIFLKGSRVIYPQLLFEKKKKKVLIATTTAGHGLPWWLRWQIIRLQCRRPGFDPWVRKIRWRRAWQPTPVFLPGESHGQRSLESYICGVAELDTTERLSTTHSRSQILAPPFTGLLTPPGRPPFPCRNSSSDWTARVSPASPTASYTPPSWRDCRVLPWNPQASLPGTHTTRGYDWCQLNELLFLCLF